MDREIKAKQSLEEALKAATAEKSAPKEKDLKKALEAAAKKEDEAQKKQKDMAAKFNQAVKDLSEAKSEVGKAQDAERTAKKAMEDMTAEKLKADALKKLASSAQAARDAADHAQNELKTKLPVVVSAFRGIAFSDDALLVLSSHEDGRVRAWSARDGAPLWTREIDAKPLGALQVKGDTLLIAKVEGAVEMPLEATWELERTIGDATSAKSPLTDRVNALAFSRDGKLLATGSGDPTRSGEIKLWDTASGRLVRELVKPHKDAVLALDFSPDGKHLASGSADRAVRVWEVSTGKHLHNLEAHSHHVLAVSYRNDGRVLASAGADAAIRTWLLDTGDVLKTINDFKKEVTGLRYIELRGQLACASGDAELRLLSDEGAKTRSDTTGSKAFLTSFASTVDGKVRIVGDASGAVRMLDAAGKICGQWTP
jgi:WD40 repeat protein